MNSNPQSSLILRCAHRLPRLAVMVLCIASAASHPALAQVANTKHNMSVTGPGTIKSTTEREICKFCHMPHNAVLPVPLWGHQLSSATYSPYTSATLSSTIPSTVNGSTKLCLSCHDGQVAVNALGGNYNPPMSGGQVYMTGPSNLGTSFLADHPVSFQPNTVGNDQITNPPANGRLEGQVHLDNGGYLQCTSCHDAHKHDRDATNAKFLVASNDHGAICTTCHVTRYWGSGSAHQTSTELFTASQGQHTGYTTITSNACESCHKPHKAGQARQLLNSAEELTCVGCHRGSASSAGGNTRVNISNEASGPFTKTYTHPTFAVSGKHVPRTLSPRTNNPSELQSDLDISNRHAECADCHNGHAAGTRSNTSGNHYYGTNSYPTSDASASLDLTGVWGVEPPVSAAWNTPVQNSYTRIDPSTKEYQVCLKCHSSYAYSTSPPLSPSNTAPNNNGVSNETDQAKEFNPANASYHGVMAAPVAGVLGTFADPAWTTTSRMYCSDCHSEDDAVNGWSIPARSGPHGSNNPFILRGAWNSNTGKNTTTDLCFRCHDYNAFINGNAAKTKFSAGASATDLHKIHVGDNGKVCMNCHVGVPHGWWRASMVVLQNDGAPYEVVGVAKIKTWNRNSGNYIKADCSTDTKCHS